MADKSLREQWEGLPSWLKTTLVVNPLTAPTAAIISMKDVEAAPNSDIEAEIAQIKDPFKQQAQAATPDIEAEIAQIKDPFAVSSEEQFYERRKQTLPAEQLGTETLMPTTGPVEMVAAVAGAGAPTIARTLATQGIKAASKVATKYVAEGVAAGLMEPGIAQAGEAVEKKHPGWGWVSEILLGLASGTTIERGAVKLAEKIIGKKIPNAVIKTIEKTATRAPKPKVFEPTEATQKIELPQDQVELVRYSTTGKTADETALTPISYFSRYKRDPMAEDSGAWAYKAASKIHASVPSSKIYKGGKFPEIDKIIKDTDVYSQMGAEEANKVIETLNKAGYVGFMYPKGSKYANEVLILQPKELSGQMAVNYIEQKANDLKMGVARWNNSRVGEPGIASSFKGENLNNLNLNGYDLRSSYLGDVQLKGTQLKRANLRDANIHAFLENTNFERSDLRGARIDGLTRNTNFNNANLQGAILRGDFNGASFKGADLRGVQVDMVPELNSFKWKGANLEGAILDKELYNKLKLASPDIVKGAKIATAEAPTTALARPAAEVPEAIEREITQIKDPFKQQAPMEQPFAGGIAYGQEFPKKEFPRGEGKPPRVRHYAGGIRAAPLDIMAPNYDARFEMNKIAEFYRESFNKGTMTLEQIQQGAEKRLAENKITMEDLREIAPHEVWDVFDQRAAAEMIGARAQELEVLRREVGRTGSKEAIDRYSRAMANFADPFGKFVGMKSEVARIFRSYQMPVSGEALVPYRAYSAITKALGGAKMTEEIARLMGQMDPTDVVSVNKVLRAIFTEKATTLDKIREAFVSWKLTGITTQVVNFTSTALNAAFSIGETVGEAAIDFMVAKATGTARQKFFGEAPWKVFGMGHGIPRGVMAGMKAFANEMSSIGPERFEARVYQAIKGKKGELTRIGNRFLLAFDDFWKTVIRSGQFSALAYRKAASEGLSGIAREKRINEILRNPKDYKDLMDDATKEAIYRAFQQELGETGQVAMKLRDKSIVGMFLIPFMRTSINIIKQGLERTPLNIPRVLYKASRGQLTRDDFTQDAARTLMGSMIAFTAFMLAREGKITGQGPENRAERAAKYRTFWKPYSINPKEGVYYPFKRFEPLNMIMGLSADAAEVWEIMTAKERVDVAGLIADSIKDNITSQTFVQSVGDTFKAMDDWDRYGETWSEKFVGGIVPSIVAGAARGVDPYMREGNGIIDAVRKRVPYLSKGLPYRRDLWGNPIEHGTGFINPYKPSIGTPSQIDNEMVRLKMHVGPPSKKIKGYELTPEEYDKYVYNAGSKVKPELDKLVQSEFYLNASDENKAKMIKRTITRYRQRVAQELYRTDLRGLR